MFTMNESYVDARFAMLGQKYGLMTIAPRVEPGQPIPVWTSTELDRQEHDEKIIKSLFLGKDNDEAPALFESVRSQLTSPLKQASLTDVASFFDC